MMLVTALCLTRNRRNFLPRAIACFQAQTHPRKELLIVADGDDVSDLVPAEANIRLVRCPEGLVIGAKRNFGCGHAMGEVIVFFDDDDWSAPGRIADQVARLEQTGKSVTAYRDLKYTDGHGWWQYTEPVGASFAFRRDWWLRHPFQHFQLGDDDLFMSEALRNGQFVAAPAGEMLRGTIHPGNTARKDAHTLSSIGWTRIA